MPDLVSLAVAVVGYGVLAALAVGIVLQFMRGRFWR